ncbi:MAG TPA: helicase-related protein [Polyangia bacterium]|nr:helicase-related protein [Polyangia bacterium]
MTAGRLGELGLRTVRDLLMRLPRAYDDLRRATPIGALAEVADGTVVLLRGRVRRLHVFPRRLLDVFVEEGEGVVRARWFRVPSAMAKSFPKGSEIALAGALRTATDGTREMIQPSVVTAALAARGDGGLGLRPRYGLVQGVKGKVLERMRGAALARLGGAQAHDGGSSARADDRAKDNDRFELVPAATRQRLALPTLVEALTRVHAPADEDAARLEALAPARRRLAFEAALVAQLAFLLRRAAVAPGAFTVPPTLAAAMRGRVEAELGFALTATQARALDEIAADLAAARPMRRLLVGDVGSGKTAVAFGAAALVAAAGAATLMMGPTEVLAEQQLRALGPLGVRLGLGIAALTGATPAAARAAILEDWALGRVQLLIGTQALLGVAGELPRLGLVIVDEQHRFGVAQRGALGLSGGSRPAPHLLSMSATPIPRSLALALHGDLDASFLTERPGGRPPPPAIVCSTEEERSAAYARLRDALAEGNQAFVVCPVRQEARRPGAVTALAQHGRLRRALAPARVGLLHGALDAGAKEEALRAFAEGRTDVLVATTVVELGIDVPNATVMIVEEADRLGLAQLHQLRGRVGRGARAGLCFLFASDGLPQDAPGRARLGLCASLDDGFRLAEADLAARGFGDLWGTAQAGEGEGDGALGAAGLADFAELTALGRREAELLLATDPLLVDPAHAALAAAARARTAMLFAGEAG